MAYDYQTERPNLFTESGCKMLIQIRDNAKRLIASAGAARMDMIMSRVSGDSWGMLACADYLVETGELRELTPPGSCTGQHRVFVSAARSD